MSFNLGSTLNGSAPTGWSSPTFTLVQDTSVPAGQKQYLVTARGGTQGGGAGDVHSLASPFTINLKRPSFLRSFITGAAAAVGLVKNQGNTFTLHIRKSEKINAIGGRTINEAKVQFVIAPETAQQSTGRDDVNAIMSVLGGILSSATHSTALVDTFLDGSL